MPVPEESEKQMNDELDEAKEMLRNAAIELCRGRAMQAKTPAAQALFDQLGALNEQHGFRVIRDLHEWNELDVQLGSMSAAVHYYLEHGFRIVSRDGTHITVDLDFDPSTQRFIGQLEDNLQPGQARRRRPAISVLVEKILDALRPKRLVAKK